MFQVQKHGWFIEQQHLGLLSQRAGEHGALALAAAQLIEGFCGEMQSSGGLHCVGGPVHIDGAVEEPGSLMRQPPHENHLTDRKRKDDVGFLGTNATFLARSRGGNNAIGFPSNWTVPE